MATSKSAFEEALSFVGNTFRGAKSAISSGVSNLAQDYSNWQKKQEEETRKRQEKTNRFLSDAKNYFNPDKAASGPNFWTTPTAQKMANVQTTITKPVQDFSAMIKVGPQKYFNPEEAPNGANFWNTKAAQGLANVQQNTPIKYVSKYGSIIDEPVTQAFKGVGAMGLRQIADIEEGNGIFNKILQVGSGAFLMPEEQRKQYAKLYRYWAEGLSQSALKDKSEVEAFMQANPIAADDPQLGLMEKFKDPEFVARGLLLNGPSLFINLAASIGTLALTKNPVLASQVALGTGFVMEGGTAYTDALDEGVPEPTARAVGVGVGVINSFLERVFPMAKLDDLASASVRRSIYQNAYKFVKDSILKEGAQETLQEIVSNVGKAVYDENYRSLAGLMTGAPEAGIFGMLLGGVANVGMSPFQGSMATNPNIGPVTTSAENLQEPTEQFRTEPGGAPAPATTQVGITSAQAASPTTASLVAQGNALFDAGNIDEGMDVLKEVTESTKQPLTNYLGESNTDVVRLETNTHGLYFGNPEPSFWLEIKMADEIASLASIAKFAKEHGQESFITATKSTDSSALPGLYVNLGRTLTNQEVVAIEKIVNEQGLGLTLNQKTGEGAAYNVPQFDSLTADQFIENAGKVVEALGASGFDVKNFGIEKYSTKVYNNDEYDRLITAATGRLGQQNKGVQPEGAGTGEVGEITNQIRPDTGGVQEETTGPYRIQVEEAPYNLDVSQVEETLKQFFDENEVGFLANDPGTIVTGDGQIAAGKYSQALIQAVQQDGKVQDQTIYHEAFHAYVDMFADQKLHEQALAQIKTEMALKDDVAGDEALAGGFANWMQNKQTGFTGKIQNFFEWLFNNLKGFIGKKSQVEAIYQEMLAKKRAAGVKSGKFALSYRDAQGVTVNGVYQPNLTAKIIQTLINEVKGGEEGTTSVQHIQNITNRGGLKQVERELALDVANRLAVDGKVNVNEFIKAYKRGLLPLEAGTETSWENIVLPDAVRGYVSNYFERIYSSPFETTLGKHFRNFPNYFAHARVEDLGDGATRRLIEIQSDMFQIPMEDFERQFVSPEGINRLQDIVNATRDKASIDPKTFRENVVEEFGKLKPRDIVNKIGLDKRHANKIRSYVEEMNRRVEHAEENIKSLQNESKTAEDWRKSDISNLIKDDERWISEIKAVRKFYTEIEKVLPDPPVGVMTMDKMIRPYKNVWFERIIKEEIARAAADGKEKIQIPTGETIARIEGYVGSSAVPEDVGVGESFDYGGADYVVLEDFGSSVTAVDEYQIDRRFDWHDAVQEEVDNEVADRVEYEFDQLVEGRTAVVDFELSRLIGHTAISVEQENAFKANPQEYLKNKNAREDLVSKLRDEIQREVEDRYTTAEDFAKKWSDETGVTYYAAGDEIIVLKPDSYTEELSKGTPEDFDEGELSDDQMTIYNRYQNEYPKYLKKMRPDLKEVTDENGISWWETKITEKDKAAIEAFRVEKKNAPPKVEDSIENTDDFSLAMEALRKFRGYKVDLYTETPVLSDQELSMKALAESRGFQPIPPELVSQIAPEAMDRINELNDMRAEFVKQMGDIEDVNKNYDFYTKRFGKLMYKKELSNLKTELKGLVKGIDNEIKQLETQTVQVEPPAPSNEELAMKLLEQSRNADQGQIAAGEPPAIPQAELPPAAPLQQATEPSGPEGFSENSQKDTETAFRNKAKTEGLPPDLSARNDLDKFNTIVSWMIGQHNVAQITGTEMGEQLTGISKNSGLDVMYAVEEGGSADPEIDAGVKKIRALYEELYKVAKDVPEIDMGYIENYITHIWDMNMEDVATAYRQWKTKFSYANERTVPTIKEGIAMGLKLKYEHPAPVIAQYTTKLYQTIANIEAFKAMRESGLLVPYPQAKHLPGYIPVVAPGIKRAYSVDTSDGGKRTVAGDYYAPKSVANVLNRVFSPQEPVGAMEKGLHTAARISGAMQDIGLSGGIPYTPLNAWTFGQLYREMATNIGGMLTSPLYSIKRMGSLVGSTLRPLIPGASTNFFKNNVSQIKKMVARNIPLTTTYTIDDLMDTSFKEKFIGKDLRGTWNKAVFDATFRKFMPMVQISMFNQIESAALNKGYGADQSADVAADAVKKFYGIVGTDDKVLRSKIMEDVLTTFFFAPRYRETMARSWVNTLAAVLPVKIENKKLSFNNPFSLANKTNTNLMIGSILTLAVYNMLNYALTGRRLKDNPPGTEDKLLIPLSDGYTMGIPLFPSTGTVVRYGLGFLDELRQGDTEGMVDQGKNLLSFMIRPPLDALTNQDYYGNKIYADTDDPTTRWGKIGSYIALQYNHPWIRAFVNQNGGWFLGKEFQKKPDYQNMLEALEAPTRFYKSKSLESRYYYENLKNVRGTLSPDDQKIWDKLHSQGGYFFDVEDGLPVYDKRSAMANALDRLANPDVVRAETDAAVKTAQEQGTPISPFYALDKDQQFTVLLLKTFYPGDPQYKQIKDANIEWLQPYWDKTNAWSKEMVRLGVFEDKSADVISQSRKQAVLGLYLQGVTDANAISTMLNEGAKKSGYQTGDWTPEEVSKYITSSDFIQATPELQKKLDYYNTLPMGTGARSRFVNANPDVKAYFNALTERTNMSRWELGLPPVAGYGGGYGDYTKKITLKIPKVELPKRSIKVSNYTLAGKPIKSGSLTSNLPKNPISAPRISSGYQMRNLTPLSLKNRVPLNLSQIGR